MTRNDMAGDSAATILGLKFITDSIGSVNQETPAYNKYIVDEIDFNDILDGIDDEIYIKMDCEGKEYDILNSINEKHFTKIKQLYVEFHAHDEIMRNERDRIINEYEYKHNIKILNWD
jgi:FkbM family methyltransferase